MSDPAIKLFGKTIQLTPNDDVSPAPDDCDERTSSDHNNLIHKNSASGEGSMDSKQDDGGSETSGSEEKALKKPDKILPCPRCNSMDTKFCYFNNYNVNQPRHFCKNCQRYWTAGGTMRNVPVGAGRRKNKNSSSSAPRYIVTPDTPNAMVYPPLRPNAPPAPPWLTQWNPAHWSSTVPPLPFPVPVYWSCGVPGSSGPSSPLGKHPREGPTQKSSSNEQEGDENRTETKVLVPKTLRIDDPSEAAKSSIWTTLGITQETSKPRDSGVFFRGLQSKGITSGAETSSVLQANPAALSRSLTYHERAE